MSKLYSYSASAYTDPADHCSGLSVRCWLDD